jgi:glycosyltransferase involved in cell wall biosynthesis
VKILLVTYSAYPRIGGRSTYISLLKSTLERRGHSVDILAHAPGQNEIYIVGGKRVNKAALRRRVAAEIVPQLHRRFPGLPPWIVWRETERYCFEEAIRQFDFSPYDLIHTQDILSSLACQRAIRDRPIVATFHNCKAEEWQVNGEAEQKLPIERAYVAREELLSVERTKWVIVPSRWLKDALTRLGATSERFRVVSYGMDIPRFQQSMRQPTELKKPADCPLILCPARLVPIKGHTFLFAALQRLKEEGRRFVCWVAGNGVLEQNLQQEVRLRGIDDVVRFIGGRSDLPAILAITDIVVLPTLHDTLPLVIMEAQLAGVAVISTRVGGVTEMIEHGRTGLLGPAGDPDYLWHSLRDLLANQAERERLARNAQTVALQTYSDARMVGHTIALYQEAVRSAAAGEAYVEQTTIDERLLGPVYRLGLPAPLRPTGTLVGTVRAPDGRPQPHAAVHLMDMSWVTLAVTHCDRNGRFSFHQIPAGKYAMIISVGECWKSRELVVHEDEVTCCHANL